MKNKLLLIIAMTHAVCTWAQPFNWSVNSSGIYRDGSPFYMRGQSWAKETPITYGLGTSCETDLKAKLSALNAIGVNTLRIYGSPDDSDWSGSSNFANLIKWIEEWNVANPDGGDPNNAMYYFVQINPEDPQSLISDDLPENSSASFNRAIHDTSHPGSVASLIQTVDNITGGSDYLLGYMIYHELNGSNKYIDWYNTVGASGIEDFMNDVADAIHNTYASGKLVTHTGDAKQPTADIYEQIENLDSSPGNVFENFDIIGFNLYISTKEMLNEGSYYDRIPQRRGFSVNSNRGWYIGETGASSDVAAPTTIPAVNYTQSQGLANLQIMWQKSEELGNLIGFMLFTVQDNDLGDPISDNMKQRGYFDVYGDQKMLYYAYPDVVNEISTNERYHYTDDHAVGITIVDNANDYTITFDFENKTASSIDFFWSIYGDDGSSNQRFSSLHDEAYVSLSGGQSTSVVKTVSKPGTNDLFAVEALVIDDLTPSNSYSYGRDHLLADAIGTVAGLNINTSNTPDRPQSNLPSPWDSSDIGNVAAAGSADYSSGSFDIEGSGADIWNTADEFRYVYQEVSGDVTITARVVSIENTNAWAKAGVMIRESLTSGSKHAMSVITPSRGTSFQRRTNTNGSSAHTTVSSITAPYWVRMERSGNTFTSSYSSDGNNWTAHGSTSITMGSDVYVGLATTSHNDGTLCSSMIDNVSVSTGSSSTTITLSPTDDAYVRGGSYASSNYGSDSQLVIKQGSSSDYFRKSYLSFDLSNEGLSSVSSAVVRVYASTSGSIDITAYQTGDSWTENAINWNNAPGFGSTLGAVSFSSSGQYYEWDITTYVQNELANDEVVSVAFYDAGASNTQIVLNSKEASSNTPQLVISGTVGGGSRVAHDSKNLSVQNLDWQVYPNPSSGFLYFDVPEGQLTNFRLMDLSGKEVFSAAVIRNSADLRSVGNGIYLLEVFGKDSQTIRKKIILNQ